MNTRNPIQQIVNNLRAWTQKVEAGGAPEYREQIRNGAAAFAASATAVVGAKIAGTVEVFRRKFASWFGEAPTTPNPFDVDSHTRTARLHFLGAYGSLGLEIVMAIGLTIQRTNLPNPVAVIVGVSLAVGYTLAAKGFFANRVAAYDETPRVAREYLGLWLRRLTILTVISLAVVFIARGADGSVLGFMSMAFGTAMATLAIVAPLLSAVNWVAGDLHMWSHRLTHEWEKLTTLNAQLQALVNDGGNPPPTPTNAGTPPPTAPSASTATSTPTNHGTSPVMPMIVSMLLLSSAASAQPVGYIFPDTTTSVEVSANDTTVAAIAEKVSELGQLGTGRWHVVPFADDAFKAVGRVFTLPKIPTAPCAPIASSSREIDIFKAATEARELHAKRECAKAATDAHLTHDRQWNNTLNAIKEAIGVPRRSATCTGIVDLLRRIARLRDAVVIAATDGVETCGQWQRVAAPPASVKTFIVLLPSKGSTSRSYATDWEARATRLRSIAPWVQIVAPWEIGEIVTRFP